jgi:hypothetical protein
MSAKRRADGALDYGNEDAEDEEEQMQRAAKKKTDDYAAGPGDYTSQLFDPEAPLLAVEEEKKE